MLHQREFSEEFDIKNWASIIFGIRKNLNLSQAELATKLNFSRDTIIRYEYSKKVPRKRSIKKVLEFITKNNLDINTLKEIGNSCINGFIKDTRIKKLNLEHSKELAELIGIILGDGEILEDGIRISFDQKKDKNFLYKRIFLLIKNIIGNKISYESHQRIVFYNVAFVRYLEEDCNLKHGSKSRNNWNIPDWCFNNRNYLKSALRGLFDTDGFIGSNGGRITIMYGRFSDKCIALVKSMEKALDILKIRYLTKHTKDGRYMIIITGIDSVLRFFMLIGSSNLKHIVRFLLWRISRYNAKIEKEGMNNLIFLIDKLTNINVTKLKLPFLWNKDNKEFLDLIEKDLQYLESIKIRNAYKWDKISSELLKKVTAKKISNDLNIGERSVRRWGDGTRQPSVKFVPYLVNLSKTLNINMLLFVV